MPLVVKYPDIISNHYIVECFWTAYIKIIELCFHASSHYSLCLSTFHCYFLHSINNTHISFAYFRLDFDYCASTLFYCDENAECLNGLNTYYCRCKFGYYGDGKVCNKTSDLTPIVKTVDKVVDCNGNYFTIVFWSDVIGVIWTRFRARKKLTHI